MDWGVLPTLPKRRTRKLEALSERVPNPGSRVHQVGARIPERNHRGQIHRLFVGLQEGRRGFAVSSNRPCRQSLLRVEAECPIFLLMEG